MKRFDSAETRDMNYMRKNRTLTRTQRDMLSEVYGIKTKDTTTERDVLKKLRKIKVDGFGKNSFKSTF